MGLLSGIKALFSPKTIAETAKSAVRGLDSIVYTEQEKAEKTQAAQTLYAELWKAAVPSAISRRVIAAIMVSVWAILVLTAMVLIVLGYDPRATKVIDLLMNVVKDPVSVIVGFYFLKDIVKTFRETK